MGENKIENLFAFALETNDLENFILGNDKYFVLDREYGEHWVLGSYNSYIEPYIAHLNGLLPEIFWKTIYSILENSTDKNIFLDFLVGYFIPYYNCPDKSLLVSRTEHTPKNNIHQIKNFLQTQKDSLIADKRGSGADWNSPSGLLGGVTANLQLIEKRGGPNFL
ncbi:hypothetical protein AD998_14450 [bacterium 336/3]|jgi:hypothetical protein|nr:hypothetical protein AD998_14450 [bacterium 336/3]